MKKLLWILCLLLFYQPVLAAEIQNKSDEEILGKQNMTFCAMGGWDGGNYDSVGIDGNGYLEVNLAPLDAEIDDITCYEQKNATATFVQATCDNSGGDQILAANASRVRATVKNISTVTAYVGFATTVTTSNGYPLVQDEAYEFTGNTDSINCITSSGTATFAVWEW